MARSPISLTKELAPFAEGAPSDDLQVEEISEDEVLVGDPDLDVGMEDSPNDFDSN